MSNDNKPTGALSALMPSRRAKLKIWAIRSLIVVVAAYIFVRMGVGAWFIWVAWAYVAVTLVLAFVLTRGQTGAGSGSAAGDRSGGDAD